MTDTTLSLTVNQNITLRSPVVEDAQVLFALVDDNRSYLRQWLPWLDFNSSVADSRQFISDSRAGHDDGRAIVLLICYQQEVVGVIGFNHIDTANKACSIGYWLAKAWQGKGIITLSTTRLVDYALTDLNLHRVSISAATENVASRAIPERLGFTQEGVSKDAEWLYDHYVDLVRYAITAPQWRGPANE